MFIVAAAAILNAVVIKLPVSAGLELMYASTFIACCRPVHAAGAKGYVRIRSS